MIALITGITGQDGSYLAEQLLEKGYIVHGTARRSSVINTSRIDHLISDYDNDKKLILHYSDLLDPGSVSNLINKIQPDEVYNLAAQHMLLFHLKTQYLHPKLVHWVLFHYLKQLEIMIKKLNFIKPHHQKCMEVQ